MASTASTAMKRATVFLMVGFYLLKSMRSLEIQSHSDGNRLPHIQRLVKLKSSFDRPLCV